MYDLAPPTMKAQFNLINKPNQSIKLSVDISIKSSNKNDLKKYIYNKLCIFKYSINIIKSQYSLNIYQQKIPKSHFNKSVLGSFIYDNSIKYSISQVSINVSKDIDLNAIVYGFLQKDFIYSIYKKNSSLKKFLPCNNCLTMDSPLIKLQSASTHIPPWHSQFPLFTAALTRS